MRYPSIDILRMLAIFVMVLVHFGENLSGYTLPIAGLGAPLFAFLSGVSYRLWANGQEAKGRSEEEIFKVSVRRGLFVFGVGIAFNVLVWLPEDTFNWDVLTFIGAALLLLNWARSIPLPVLAFTAVLALLISPVLRAQADYSSYWLNGYFDPDLTLSDTIIGFLATGYFPIFPWITFSLTGFVTATWLFARSTESAEPVFRREGPRKTQLPPEPLPSPWPMMMVGLTFVVVAFLLLAVRPYLPATITKNLLQGWTMFPPTIPYVLGTLGMALTLFGSGHLWIDRNPNIQKLTLLLSVAKTFSRYAFSIYVLHHIVHLWPLWLYGAATGNEPTFLWKIAMPLTLSLPLAVMFLIICYLWLRWLGTKEKPGIELWMRWLCD